MRKKDYTRLISLNNNELLAIINIETGEIHIENTNKRNLKEEKSKLDYEDFSIVNNKAIKKIIEFDLLENDEIGILYHMISLTEFNTNSLKLLNNHTTNIELCEQFKIGKNRISKVFGKLYKLGIFLSYRVYENENKEYWVLNLNISWRGRIKNDILFEFFKNTLISKLLNS